MIFYSLFFEIGFLLDAIFFYGGPLENQYKNVHLGRLMFSGNLLTTNKNNDVVRSSGKVPVFDKHLKKAGGHIGRNVVEITIKMKTIVRKPLMIKIIKLLYSELLISVI